MFWCDWGAEDKKSSGWRGQVKVIKRQSVGKVSEA